MVDEVQSSGVSTVGPSGACAPPTHFQFSCLIDETTCQTFSYIL